jgi:hypothetical protein
MVLANGSKAYTDELFELAERKNSKLCVLEDTTKNREKLWDQSESVILPEVPEVAVLQTLMQRQIVPIMPQNKFLSDFNAQKESGEAFTFEESNIWQCVAAVIRAQENFKFAYDWKNLKKSLKEVKLG